jgi:hypothetical protein
MTHRRTRSQDRLAAEAEEAELLAQAQAQAEEEDEIGSRLPREVININRHLDHQQHTMDAIQGNLSKLTEMVAQLARPTTGSPELAQPTAEQNPFSTPPPPPPNLSPIQEQPTPPSSTAKLPDPPLQQPNSQKDTPLYTQSPEQNQQQQPPNPPPFSTPNHNTPSSSTHQPAKHQFQNTNPSNQPHLYNPTPPPPPVQQQYYPAYPPYQNPPPYYYPPPPPNFQQFSPQQGYYHYPWQQQPYTPPQIYPPPPPTPNPYQYPQPPPHASTNRSPVQPVAVHTTATPNQTQVNLQDPYIRTPNVELPLFHGENAQNWIEECESIFSLIGIPNESKVKWANAHIRGKAKTWLSGSNLNLYLLNWTQFCQLICERFPVPGEHESMEQFQHLRQTGTVNQYIDIFEEYMICMQRDHSYLTDNFFLLRFISGLKETVKHAVKSHNPSTMKSAYWHARQ